MDTILMVAGRGSRLKPLTESRPKCLIPVLDRPIIQWEVSLLRELGIDNILMITGYKEQMIKNYFDITNASLSSPYHINIDFIHQEKQTGTADAIYLAKDYVDGEFLVLSGDTIFLKEDVKRLMKQNNSFLYTKQHERLHEYGTLEFDKKDDTLIKKIYEKETKPVSNFVNCGAYHFDKRIFDYIPKTHVDERFKERIITNTINLMLERKIPFHGIYTDNLYEITYPKDIQEVERKLNEE
jgi:NDP-sugar pyrophosphorylase family protein